MPTGSFPNSGIHFVEVPGTSIVTFETFCARSHTFPLYEADAGMVSAPVNAVHSPLKLAAASADAAAGIAASMIGISAFISSTKPPNACAKAKALALNTGVESETTGAAGSGVIDIR